MQQPSTTHVDGPRPRTQGANGATAPRVPGPAMIRAEESAAVALMVHDRRDRALLIVGDAGAGKSYLLSSVGAAPGMAVCRVRASATESGIALSGLSAIVSGFEDPAVRRLADPLLSPLPRRRSAAALAAELLSLIRQSVARSTLLLIDDLHLFDGTSRAVVAMMAMRLGGTGLRIIATAEPPCGLELAALPRMHLLPLEAPQIGDLVSELTGARPDAAVTRIISTASAGNIRAALEITRRMRPAQLDHGAPVELPARLPADLRPPPLGAETSPADLVLRRLSTAHLHSEAAITRREPEAESALQDLLSLDRVIWEGRRLRLRDPVTRSLIYWSLESGERHALHWTAAHAESGLDPRLAAWHRSWHQPGALGPEELLRCATDFAVEGRTWQSVELAERALTIHRGGQIDCGALTELATTFFHAGELDLADRYARFSRRCEPNERLAPRLALLRAGIEFLDSGRTPPPESELALSTRDPDDAVTVAVALAAVHLARWETERAGALLKRTIPRGATVETTRRHVLVDALRAAMEGDPGPVSRALASALDEDPVALLLLGRGLTYLDQDHDARRVLRMLETHEPPPSPLLLQLAQTFHAEVEMRAGDEAAASAAIDRALASRRETSFGGALLDPLLAWRLLASGDDVRAAELVQECHRRYGVNDPALSAWLAAASGRFELAAGRFDDAIAHLGQAASVSAAFSNPTLLRCDVDLVEALVLADRWPEAVEHARAFTIRSARFRTPWTLHARALVEALVSSDENALPLFETALGRASSPDLAFARARTLVCLADRLERMGRRREALGHSRRARAILDEVGALSWLRRVDGGADGGPPVHSLLAAIPTDELRVVRLVQQGKRNKEIAAELYVSLRTVEVRLTRVYQRIGVNSRGQLLSLLAATPPDSTRPD